MPRARSFVTATVLFASGILLTGLACAGLLAPTTEVIPTAVPASATALPTQTSLPLYQQVVLTSSPFKDQGDLFRYAITAQVPVLVGSEDPRVTAFNAEMVALINKTATDFKQNLIDLPPTTVSTASSLDVRYNVLSSPGNILSLKFDIEAYYTGAAHPGHSSRTVNFDLEAGRDLTLADLFLDDSDYLMALSKYCIGELSTRDIGFQGFELGATATAGNYRNWNITPNGLMITFDEYQVAPYAAGPQTIVIPYKMLVQLIEPDGPLAPYLR